MATRKSKPTAAQVPASSPARQLAGFIGKFAPPNQRLIKTVRKVIRSRLPTAVELVYDNYNFFVIGYSPTQRPSDAVLSIAADAGGVALCFLHGATLPDPTGILRGSGNQVRSIRIPAVSELDRPEVKRLLKAAVAASRAPFPSDGPSELVIRSVSAKQRPRRKST